MNIKAALIILCLSCITLTSRSQPQGKTWAVVIGISDYKNITGLNYADRDAQAFYDYLVHTEGGPMLAPSQIRLLLNKNAQASDIYGTLEWLKESVKPNDRVIFYYSGHADVEQKNPQKDAYLLAYDAPVTAYAINGTISINYLKQYLYGYLNVNKAGLVIIITDACRSGVLAGGAEGLKLTNNALSETQGGRLVKILSAQAGERAFEGSKWGGGRGVFSYFLLKGIEGLADRNNDGYISTDELAAYLPHAIGDATGDVQNPEIEGDAQQKLFPFNKKLLKTAEQAGDKPVKLSVDIGPGLADNIAPSILARYQKYLGFVKQGRLLYAADKHGGVNYSDSLNCARGYYEKLIKDPRANAIRATLRSSFMAALGKKTQVYLDHYIKGERSEMQANVYEPMHEMYYLRSMMSQADVLYNYIMARVYYMEILNRKNDNKGTIGLLKEALNFESDAPYVFNELITAYGTVGKVDSAKFFFDKAVVIAPKWASLYNNMGVAIYSNLKDTSLALSYYTKAIQQDSTCIEAYINFGALNQRPGNFVIALDYHKKAIEHNGLLLPGYNTKRLAIAYYNAGVDYQGLKNDSAAIANYNMAIRLDSTFFNSYSRLLTMYAQKGNVDLAIDNYRHVIDLDPPNAADYFTIANMYAERKRYAQAITCFKKAIHIDPKHGDYFYNLACACCLTGKATDGLAYFEHALSLGYLDYANISKDNDINALRSMGKFKKIMHQYFPNSK